MKNLTISAILFFLSIAAVEVLASEGFVMKGEVKNEVIEKTQANLIIQRSDEGNANATLYYRIWVDGKHIGKLKRGRAMRLQLSAGTHSIRANDPAHTERTVQISAQGVTYIQADINKKRQLSLTVTQPSEQIVSMPDHSEKTLQQ